jgi:hypothetical protein
MAEEKVGNEQPESIENQEEGLSTDKVAQPVKEKDTDFFGDLSDDRAKGAWQTRYNKEAWKQINEEKLYLILVFVISLSIPLILGIIDKEFIKSQADYEHLKKYIYSFFGGILGGTMYAAKWLVHTVAKNTWNEDRHLWRIFTPFVSGALAFSIILLMDCGVISIVDQKQFNFYKAYGIGFLVGYFSDNAIGKLTEIAKVFFGGTKS